MTQEIHLDDTAALKERWANVLNDPTVTDIIETKIPNKGSSFADEDVDAYLARGLAHVEYFRSIVAALDEEQPR